MKNLKIFIFELWNENFKFLKLEMKIFLWNLKKMAISPEGNEKIWKWRNHIFRLCHRDKTSNNTPIPPMYTTLYHRCKLWWYTINLSRWILFQQWYKVVWSTLKEPCNYMLRKIKVPCKIKKAKSYWSGCPVLGHLAEPEWGNVQGKLP
jgi:hypothetical protein